MATDTLVALVVGGLLGLMVGASQYHRITTFQNPLVRRDLAGRPLGGAFPLSVGVAILWFGIGFGIVKLIGWLIRLIV